MLQIRPIENAELAPMILKSLEIGPKTVIAIRLWIEIKERLWVSDVQLVETLFDLIEAGLVSAQEVGTISGLDAVEQGLRTGPLMLYSLKRCRDSHAQAS